MKSKRKIGWFGLVFLAVVSAAVLLPACSPAAFEETYNDDARIAKNSANATVEVKSKSILLSDKYTFSADKFSGMKTVKKLDLPADPVFKNVKLTVSEGKFKVVLVKDGEVYVLTDKDTDGNIETTLAAGQYTLKIVGVDAKVSLSMGLSEFA